MEDEKDEMSIFNSNDMELNMDFNYEGFDKPVEDEKDSLEEEDEKNIKPVDEEDDSQESVDGEEEDSEGDSNDDDSSPNLYSSFSSVLYEQGIIPSLESSEEIKSIDDLALAIKKEIDLQTHDRVEDYLNNLDLDKIASSKKTQLTLETIDEEYLKKNLDIAKDIIFRDYINQGLSEDRARKMLRKTIDLGEDVIIEDALESKESLKEFEKKQEENEKSRYQENLKEQIKQQDEVNNRIRDYVFNSKEVVKGIPNTKILQERVYKSMVEPVAKNPETGEMMNQLMSDRSKNPIEFDTRMYYFYELTKGFNDLGSIKNTVGSKNTKNLENLLRKTSFEDNGTPAYLTDPQSYGGIGSELVI